MTCPDGYDTNDCRNADRCIARGKDLDENLCPVQCPPICDDNQVLCSGGINAHGCKDVDVCVPKVIGHDGAECVTACPITCAAATEEKVLGGVDENGCPKPDVCGVQMLLGDWTHDGECTASGKDSSCGPGTQLQKRTCTDGTVEKCNDADKQRTVTCSVPGTKLPDCSGAKYDLNPGPKCKTGYTPITSSWKDCKAAAKSLGFQGDSVAYVDYEYSWGTDRPVGCFQSDGNERFHFNKGSGGNAQGSDKILCKATEEGCKKGCDRPSGGCSASYDVYANDIDCDNDGICDQSCHTTINNDRWLVLSSEGCPATWGSLRAVSDCPAAFNNPAPGT